MDIIVEHLWKRYGDKQVFQDYSLRIRQGTVSAIMAPSGAGKTTLIRLLAGLETADSGTISGLDGKKVSMVFQEDRLCSHLSAVMNIRFVCDKNISKNQICNELQQVGLGGSELRPVSELSGGMKRRVALVRALLVPYDILILDEPFKGLDEEMKEKVMDYTKEKSSGKTVILVTHDEKEAEYMGGSSPIYRL